MRRQLFRRAIDALEKAPVEGPKADKTALKEAIDKASAVDSSKYTTASLEKLYAALDTAQTLYEDETAEQAAVDEAAGSPERGHRRPGKNCLK